MLQSCYFLYRSTIFTGACSICKLCCRQPATSQTKLFSMRIYRKFEEYDAGSCVIVSCPNYNHPEAFYNRSRLFNTDPRQPRLAAPLPLIFIYTLRAITKVLYILNVFYIPHANRDKSFLYIAALYLGCVTSYSGFTDRSL